MAYTLVIGNALDVRVKGDVKGDRGLVNFNFTLRMNRMDIAQYRAAIKPDSEVLVKDFLASNTLGWEGQRLVLGEDGQPAAYSREAMDVLLSVVGMEQVIFAAYDRTLTAAATPQGRAGN
jgi:hypothetical protein